MKKLSLLLSFFCFFSISIEAQSDYEFKSDILDFLRNESKFTGERVLTNRWGVELGLGFDVEPKTIREFGTFGIRENKYSSFFLETDLAFKYYFLFNKHRGNGLFIGPYTRVGTSMFVQNGYIDKWEEVNNRQASEWMSTTRGFKSIEFGIVGGWKFLAREKFIIEPGIIYTLQETVGKGSSDLDFGIVSVIEWTFKTGIRF